MMQNIKECPRVGKADELPESSTARILGWTATYFGFINSMRYLVLPLYCMSAYLRSHLQ